MSKTMNRENYRLLEDYMSSCMEDSAHDRGHVYREADAAMDKINEKLKELYIF